MPEPIQTPEEGTEPVQPETEPKPTEPAQPTPPAVDYETKFKESQKENELLREAEKQRKQAEQELTKEPTDSDLRTAFPSWDAYDETQKELARRTFGAERTAGIASRTAQQLQQDREWNTSIEIAVTSDPALQGKEQAFKQFASKPQYRNVPMELLVSSFLQKQVTPPAPKTTPKPGLEPGNGGPKKPEKPTTMSSEDLSRLRQTDPKAYQDYLKTHDVPVDV